MSDYTQRMIDAAFAAYEAGQYAEAATALGFAVGAGRDGLVAWFIGHLALRRNEPAAALPWLTVAVEIEPSAAKAHRDLADTLRLLGRLEDAADTYLRAIAIDAAWVDPYGGLVTVLHLLNRDAEALVWGEQAIRSAADTASAHRILGTALAWHNRHAEAIGRYRAAQVLRPGDPAARYHEGLSMLALGHYHEGWQLHDARLQIGPGESGRRPLRGPIWRGEDIAGQTILLHTEQGFGDAIQFVRYAPLVAARGARVWLEVDPELVVLFGSIPGIAGVSIPGIAGVSIPGIAGVSIPGIAGVSIPGIAGVSIPGIAGVRKGVAGARPLTAEQPAFAPHCPLMSLPLAFGTQLGSSPAQVPYLHADPRRVAAWRTLLGADPRPLVGIAWAGNPAHPHDRLRSIALDLLAPLLDRRDCVFHAIQTGMAAADQQRLAALGVRDHGSVLTDFAETAALAAALDLVIAVDSAPAHLAGALARPTWLMLPWSADWRWMCDRTDSPWYPTMRLFRQPGPGQWDAVVAKVGAALDEWRGAARGQSL